MKRFEIIFMILQVPLDYLMLLLAGISAYYLRFTNLVVGVRPVTFGLTFFVFLKIILLVALLWLFLFALIGLYSADANKKLANDLGKIFFACSAGLALIALYILFSQQLFDSRFLVAASWGFSVIYVAFGRILVRGVKGLMYRMGYGLRRVVLVGNEAEVNEMARSLEQRKELGYNVVAKIDSFKLPETKRMSELSMDEMIFFNPHANEKEALQAIDFCNEKNIIFKYSADLFSVYSSNMVVNPLAGVPVVELKKTPLDGWGSVAKRIFDIIVSLLAIVIFSPLMILTAVIIFFETGRPIIYKNERFCLGGRKFFAYKFRSMYQKDCTGMQFGNEGKKAIEKEKELIKKQSIKQGPIYKIANDPRVSPFGKFIRRWSIDELPQLFNVFLGEMSIIGPRPHQPREVEKCSKEYRKVFALKPGITGLAQISGRSELSFEEEMSLDIFYIEKWSLILDLIILIKTPFVIVKKKGVL